MDHFYSFKEDQDGAGIQQEELLLSKMLRCFSKRDSLYSEEMTPNQADLCTYQAQHLINKNFLTLSKSSVLLLRRSNTLPSSEPLQQELPCSFQELVPLTKKHGSICVTSIDIRIKWTIFNSFKGTKTVRGFSQKNFCFSKMLRCFSKRDSLYSEEMTPYQAGLCTYQAQHLISKNFLTLSKSSVLLPRRSNTLPSASLNQQELLRLYQAQQTFSKISSSLPRSAHLQQELLPLTKRNICLSRTIAPLLPLHRTTKKLRPHSRSLIMLTINRDI